jgi:hypothetical protein
VATRAERCSSRAATGARALGAQQLATRRTHGALAERAGRRLLWLLCAMRPCAIGCGPPGKLATRAACGCSLLDSEDRKRQACEGESVTMNVMRPQRLPAKACVAHADSAYACAASFHRCAHAASTPSACCQRHPVRVLRQRSAVGLSTRSAQLPTLTYSSSGRVGLREKPSMYPRQ